MTPAPGRLLLLANTLDLGSADAPPIGDVIAGGTLRQAAQLTHWVVENAKAARAFLARVGQQVPLAAPLQALQIVELPRAPKGGAAARASQGGAARVGAPDFAALLSPARQGHDIGLLSDAGLPGVADPGAALVAAAHAQGLTVWPLAGASAITLALAASGLNGQSFAFVGYLPQEAVARAARIRELEARSRREQQSQFAIETPYRNQVLLRALVDTLAPTTRLAVASGLTLPDGWCRTQTVAQWRAATASPFGDAQLPSVFGWLAAG